MTAVQPPGRFGVLDIRGERVNSFMEKPPGDGTWVNGGFFVFETEVFDYLKDDSSVLEKEPLENLAKDGKLMAYKHPGFWMPMDKMKDKNDLEAMWASGIAPWKSW